MSNESISSEFIYTDFPIFEPINFTESPIYTSQIHESSELFSDLVLDYINEMLLEEDVDEKYDMLQSHPDLEATEKPFYDLIGEKYPSSPDQFPIHSTSSPESPHNQSYNFSNNWSDNLLKTFPAFEFEKGVEEAKKFLPSKDKLSLQIGEIDLKNAPKHKSRHFDESNNEETKRFIKQSAFSYEDPVIPSEIFDDVLLSGCEKFPQIVNTIRESMYKEAEKDSIVSRKLSRKKSLKDKVVDFNNLLLHCAQTISSGDHTRAYELLKQIRNHSSPRGDGSQRLAHYLANGLEARLAGNGSEIYRSLVSKRRTVGDVLKAYQLYLACCPFKKITYYFANQSILDTIEGASRVHILDLGIYFGFQWPSFIKMLSERPGGPPKLRITGIDIPEPGFRPADRIEETGQRLSEYAARFAVPFEYRAVAAKFDEVRIEDLEIEEDEMVVVNCLFRLHCPADESVIEDCPRDKVLNMIRKLKPAVFVNVVVNGTYGAPFFMSRFREALYYFSAVFDILETTTPRENEQRLLVERDLYGKHLINVISCEGAERERPETYKQWQVRCLRAGFEQLSIKRELVKKVKNGVRDFYHKDFNMDEDGKWLLEGWKGRILYGLSVWKVRCF